MTHPKTIGEAAERAADIIELARAAGDLDDPDALAELVCKHLGWPTTSLIPAQLVIALHDLNEVEPHWREKFKK